MAGEFADKVVHVTLSGRMLNGGEIWQTGFYLGYAQGEAGTPTQGTADAIRDLWATFFTSATTYIHEGYTFEEVKLARLAQNGKYDGSDVVLSYPNAVKRGGWASFPNPPQCALVATLIAGSGKGLAGKGRMYLPGIGLRIGADGKIDAQYSQNIANNLTTFFQGVYTHGGQEGVPVNASKGSKAALYINPRNVPINGIRVGNVFDTQRRRRDALDETYSNGPLIQ